MKATCQIPIATIQGLLGTGYYARILHGKVIIQRCPTRTAPPTEAQLRARQLFVQRYAQPKSSQSILPSSSKSPQSILPSSSSD